MNQESGTATFSAPSPSSDVDVQVLNKHSKISYTREFLLSLAKVYSPVKLPMEAEALISRVVHQASGLLSLPLRAPDSRCQKSVPQIFSPKIRDDVNQLLHRSDEPYLPPCRYKVLTSSTRDSNDLLNSDSSGPSGCTNQEIADREIWRKDTIIVAKEEKWHSSKNADSKDSPDEFLMSPATRNSNTFQFTSSVISKQYDASQKSSQTQGAVRSFTGPPTLLETDKNCPTPRQEVQDLITNGSVNPWLKTVNHVDTSWHLSMMDNGVHLMESKESSNLDVEHQEGTFHVMELCKSRPPSFSSEEDCGNHKKNHFEVAYEQDFMEFQLSNTSVCVYDSPGRILTSDPSEVYISPTTVEGEIQFASMIDDCESSMVYCKGISVSTKQNPSSPDFQIHRELELNSFSHSLDGELNSNYELCLPDEDSLITFDELFLMPDLENLPVVDSSMSSSPEGNPIEVDMFSPSSPREMVEKLVEFILNDESSATHVDDPVVHHGAGLGYLSHSMPPQLTRTQFCSKHLNPGRDQQNHNSFQRNSIDSTIYSFFSHTFPSNASSQPSPLYRDELRRFDHEANQSLFQQMINPGKLHLCSLSESQSGVPPHVPALQMAYCTQKLNSMQSCPFANQEPKNYGDFIRPSPDFQGDSNINPAVVDSFTEMKLRASHWQPHLRGFCS